MYLNLIKHLQFEMEEVTCYGPLNQVVPSSSLICLQTSIVVLDGNKGRLHQSPFFSNGLPTKGRAFLKPMGHDTKLRSAQTMARIFRAAWKHEVAR